MSDQTPETVGGPEKNKQIEADAKKAKASLADLREALEPLLSKSKKSLEKLEASEAVAAARSVLAVLDDALTAAERDIDRTIQSLPKPDKEASK